MMAVLINIMFNIMSRTFIVPFFPQQLLSSLLTRFQQETFLLVDEPIPAHPEESIESEKKKKKAI